jgi:hypothetical protein
MGVTCYSESLGDCSGGRSAEHYISRSVLQLAGRKIRISGFPWQDPDQPQEIGIASLSSNILCRGHNEQLSSLDVEGQNFVKSLKTCFDEAVDNSEFTHEEFEINGDLLERWFLKVLCGVLVVARGYSIHKSWLEILFRGKPFPKQSGMYFFGKLGRASWEFNLLRVISVLNNHDHIAGAKFGIGGVPMLLGFGNPGFDDPEFRSFYRPACLEVRKGDNAKRIEFSWHEYGGGGTVFMQLEGPIDQDGANPIPLVQPDAYD